MKLSPIWLIHKTLTLEQDWHMDIEESFFFGILEASKDMCIFWLSILENISWVLLKATTDMSSLF